MIIIITTTIIIVIFIRVSSILNSIKIVHQLALFYNMSFYSVLQETVEGRQLPSPYGKDYKKIIAYQTELSTVYKGAII
jgi:hypothetical protein